MNIWGSRPRVTDEGGGQFHCPRCETKSSYTEKKVQRVRTLFSVSLFAAEPAGGYIECDRCKGTFDHDVLTYDPAKERQLFLANFQSAVLNAMILMMVSDGEIDDKEVATVCRIYEQIAGRPVSERAVRARASDIRHGGGLQVYLETTAHELNEDGRALVMRALCMIAAADGVLAPEEDALIDEASRVLGIDAIPVEPMIAEMRAAS